MGQEKKAIFVTIFRFTVILGALSFFLVIMSTFSSVKSAVRMGKRTVVWIRNDQRLLDNAVIHEACKIEASSSGGSECVVLYCFDPRHYDTTEFGSKKTAEFR